MEKNWDRLDFVLGSVHFLRGDWPFDHAGQEAEFARRDINEVYADYYERITAMARSGLVDCLSHLDLVKIFGFRPTNDLTDVLDAVLSEIRVADLAMELSTAGWRKPVGELYPSDEIIRAAQAKKEFRSLPRPTRIRMCSRVRISSDWRRRWRSWGSAKSASSSSTSATLLRFNSLLLGWAILRPSPLRRRRGGCGLSRGR